VGLYTKAQQLKQFRKWMCKPHPSIRRLRFVDSFGFYGSGR